jgi:hypothetical protein
MMGRLGLALGLPGLVAAGCQFVAGDATPDAARSTDGPRALDGGTTSHDAGHDATPVDAAPPEVTFVQGTGTVNANWSSGGGDLTLSLPAPVGSGNAIAVFVSWADTGGLDSITDSLGNTFTVAGNVDDGDQQQEASVAYATEVTGGSDTITAHFNSSPCCRILIAHEVAGASATAPDAGHAGQVQGSTGTGQNAVTSTFATAGAGDYVFGVTTNTAGTGGQTISEGTGETMRETLIPSGNGNATAAEDRVVPGDGSAASTFTFGKSARALTIELVLQP